MLPFPSARSPKPSDFTPAYQNEVETALKPYGFTDAEIFAVLKSRRFTFYQNLEAVHREAAKGAEEHGLSVWRRYNREVAEAGECHDRRAASWKTAEKEMFSRKKREAGERAVSLKKEWKALKRRSLIHARMAELSEGHLHPWKDVLEKEETMIKQGKVVLGNKRKRGDDDEGTEETEGSVRRKNGARRVKGRGDTQEGGWLA